MLKLTFLTLALAAAGASARAQDAGAPPTGPCASPDSIVVRGNTRISASSILSDAALTPGPGFNYRAAQRAIRALYATGQFEDVQLSCQPSAAADRASIIVSVRERPVLTEFTVEGADRVSRKTIKDKIDLPVGKALDPAALALVLTRIDSIYEAHGYFLARVRPDSAVSDGKVKLAFRIDEGRRLAISGVRVHGNKRLSAGDVVAAMKSRPEGFFFFRRGEFDDEKYAADISDRIPAAYAARGFVDFQVVRDTVIVDRERGKALIDITVVEGPQYRVGTFDVTGNRRFSADEIGQFNPFTTQSPTVTDRVKGLVRRNSGPTNVFDRSRWEAATEKLRNAYGNEGYLFQLRINPVEERRTVAVAGGDSVHYVDLRWEIAEGTPAIINKVEIAGNDFTHESCIRSQLVSLPGDVFNRDRLIRSYQSISNLGFFESPGPTPDVNPADTLGDVNVIFRVKEKKTGNVNFGASAGGYGGIGGFIGLDQPNLFGQCKRASLNWQFGRLQNDFNLSYTDPSVRQSQVQGTVSAYRSVTRFDLSGLGRGIRTGGSVQAGFPVPHSPFSRFAVSYTGERIRYENLVAASQLAGSSPVNPFRSSVGFNYSHDTRVDMPFPTAGTQQSVSAQFTGGPLGGNNRYSRYTAEMRTYAPLGSLGGKPGAPGMKFLIGLNARAGALLGDPGLFRSSQAFTLGGVQYGEPLRGYDEFSITPNGFDPRTSNSNGSINSFGNAFFASTLELGLRISSSLYTDVFYDAGNVYARARDFDPTRLFRGAGFGVSTVTPLGPLGLDYAYGFDRVDALGRKAPKWQLHFKLGQLF